MISRRTLLGVAATTGVQAQRPRKPNLLFVVADAWRGVALPSAGDPNLRAPNLARLAREGADCRRTCPRLGQPYERSRRG